MTQKLMNNNTIWLVSDLHLGHKWMFKARKDTWKLFPKNIKTEQDFKTLIKKNWNKLISPNDVVIFLGDATFDFHLETGKIDATELISQLESYEFLTELNGQKIWILGNHDRVLFKMLKEKDYTFLDKHTHERFNEYIFKSFRNIEENPFQINNLVFSHEPTYNLGKGLINYHGHIHTGLTNDLLQKSKQHINCNVELNNWKPLKIKLDK